MEQSRGFLSIYPSVMSIPSWLALTVGLGQIVWSDGFCSLSLHGKQAFQSSLSAGGHADLAIDGNLSSKYKLQTCTHTGAEVHPWWKVDLQIPHSIGKITIVNRGECCPERLTYAVVRAGLNSNFSQNAICGSMVTSAQASVYGAHLEFTCDPPTPARFVSVDIDGNQPGVRDDNVLTLCEVMVEEYNETKCPATQLLTRLPLAGKQACQSSVNGLFTANLAIDGNPSTHLVKGRSCSATEIEVHPWWIVDLGTSHCLGKITIVNRADCCPERLTGAVVRLGLNVNFSKNAICGSAVTSSLALVYGARLDFKCDSPTPARYVSVDIDGNQPAGRTTNSILTLCEVIVEEYPMTECPSPAAFTKSTVRGSCGFKLIREGPCAINTCPLSTSLTGSLMPCTFRCKRDADCWFFDYAPTTGRCRLYAEKFVDLSRDGDLFCLGYAVVGCDVVKVDP